MRIRIQLDFSGYFKIFSGFPRIFKTCDRKFEPRWDFFGIFRIFRDLWSMRIQTQVNSSGFLRIFSGIFSDISKCFPILNFYHSFFRISSGFLATIKDNSGSFNNISGSFLIIIFYHWFFSIFQDFSAFYQDS